MAELRILVADEHPVLRAGLQLLLDAQPDMRVVGQAGTGREALRQAYQLLPDLVVMAVSLPELSGADVTEQLKRAFPSMHVVVLTRHRSHGYLKRLMRAGAGGYVLKQASVTDLLRALRIVAAGGTYIDPQLIGSPGEPAAGGRLVPAPPTDSPLLLHSAASNCRCVPPAVPSSIHRARPAGSV